MTLATLPSRRTYIGFLLALVPALLVVAMTAGQPAPGAQAAAESVRFQPSASLQAEVADEFGFWIVVDDLQHEGSIAYDDDRDTTPDRFVPSEGLGAFEFTIQYDVTMLQFRDARIGGLGEDEDTERSFQCLQRTDEPGSVTFGCISFGSEGGPEGDLTLAEFSFEPIAPGATTLTLGDVVLAGPLADDIDVSVESVHQVEITGSAPAGPVAGPNDTLDPTDGDGQGSSSAADPKGQSQDGDETGDGDKTGGQADEDDPPAEGSGEDPDVGDTPGSQVIAIDRTGGRLERNLGQQPATLRP